MTPEALREALLNFAYKLKAAFRRVAEEVRSLLALIRRSGVLEAANEEAHTELECSECATVACFDCGLATPHRDWCSWSGRRG